ncbi:alpha/beta hydrolase [Euzebya sp.]|uniref:alpha/beta hydrolase n=1 Tax=Euzebya sp. TaxID=1971409 RepID=UPI003514B6CD
MTTGPPPTDRAHLATAAEVVIALHLVVVALTADLDAAGRVVVAVVVLAPLAVAAALRRSDRAGRRGVGMVLSGLVGTLAGAGVGPVHLAAVGPSPAAVLGVAALVCGLVLLVAGAVTAVRAVRGWRRLWAVPIALVVLQVLGPSVPVALYATHVPIAHVETTPPAGAQRVVVPAGDGVDLVAWYTPSRDGAAVLLRHGSGSASSKASTTRHAAVLADHGYGVLAMDARGHGESGGTAMDLGWHGDDDVAAGVAWLVGQPDVDADRIAGVGLSMGGEELIGALPAVPGLRAVVAEGATGRTAADRRHLGFVGPQALVDRIVSAVTFGTADLLTRASSPTPLADAIAALDGRSVLVIAGAPEPEVLTARHLHDLAPGDVEVWTVPAAGHIAALQVDPDGWERTVIGFLDAALVTPSASRP